ncbi:MAG: response regulator transcription factor [Bacteroidales bacterium]|nr:response regulator transcription factor [Bacteroidales bacterium]MBN2756382.1 response regulator transcription factor [Bacteroidales bacterium]
MGLKTIIIDDESDAISSLKLIINEYLPELELIATFNNPIIAKKEIPELKPDLVFLDINMPAMNGFELLDNIKEHNFKIIFITAFDEFAIKAFKYSAIDYILKPVDIDQLISTISKIKKEEPSLNNFNLNYNKFLNFLNHHKTKKLMVSTLDDVHYLDTDDIIYIHAEGSYAKIIRNNNSPILVSKNLKDFESQLHYEHFFRSHNSYLINLNFVKKFLKSDGGSIEMSNGDITPISKRKRNEFNEIMIKIFNL